MKKLLLSLAYFMAFTYVYSQSYKDMQVVDSIVSEQIKWEKKMCNNGMPIEIVYERSTYPNSAGGTGIEVLIRNLSTKEIKYISFSGYPINAVNDKCFCDVKKHSHITLKGVGPIKYGEYKDYAWRNVWYNGDIKKYIPTSIIIQYMDGSSVRISGENIKKIISLPPSDMVIIEALVKHNIEAWKIRKHLYESNTSKKVYNILMRCAKNEIILKHECRLRKLNDN